MYIMTSGTHRHANLKGGTDLLECTDILLLGQKDKRTFAGCRKLSENVGPQNKTKQNKMYSM